MFHNRMYNVIPSTVFLKGIENNRNKRKHVRKLILIICVGDFPFLLII